MTDYDIHSCGYYCDRHACILRQRDELRDKLFEEIHSSERNIQTSDSQAAESAQSWVGLTDDEKLIIVFETDNPIDVLAATEAKLKEKNGG